LSKKFTDLEHVIDKKFNSFEEKYEKYNKSTEDKSTFYESKSKFVEEKAKLIENKTAELENKINLMLGEFEKKNKEYEETIKHIMFEKEALEQKVSRNMEAELKQITEKVSSLETSLVNINNNDDFFKKSMTSFTKSPSSTFKRGLLQDHLLKSDIFKGLLENKDIKFIYRASENGFLAVKFHEACDGKENTITIAKSENGYIFGGYTPLKWKSCKWEFNRDETKSGFLFSITHNTKHNHFQHEDKAILCNSDNGPTFGGGCDLYISNECNKNLKSYSRLGYSYKPKEGHKIDTEESRNYFAGRYNFRVVEYEVFQLAEF